MFAGVSEGGHINEAVQESHAATDVLPGEQWMDSVIICD